VFRWLNSNTEDTEGVEIEVGGFDGAFVRVKLFAVRDSLTLREQRTQRTLKGLRLKLAASMELL